MNTSKTDVGLRPRIPGCQKHTHGDFAGGGSACQVIHRTAWQGDFLSC